MEEEIGDDGGVSNNSGIIVIDIFSVTISPDDSCSGATTVTSSTGISTERYYYHTNHLGSVIALTNGSGAIVQSYTYDSFGKAYVMSGSGAGSGTGTITPIENYTGNTYSNTRLYTGREYDRETGLYYLRARYYDASIGRFISRDPIGQNDQVNLYTYVGNSPVMYTDPTGEFLETAWDIGNTAYDAGRLIKNTAEVAYGGAKLAYASATDNTCMKKQALAGIKQDASELGEASIDARTDALATLIPFVPAGTTKVLRAGKKVEQIGKEAIEQATKQTTKQVKKIHGNSLDSPEPTTLYELTNKKNGEHLKYGITSQNPIERRYTQKFLDKYDMTPLTNGTRREMHTLENQMILNNPRGPLQLNNH